MAARKRRVNEVLSAAGKKGMLARWGEGVGEKTVQVRAYETDAEKLREMAPRTADAIRHLLEDGGGGE